MADEIAQNGWTAVPVDAAKILQDKPYLHEPAPLLVSDIPFPSDDPVVARVQQYVKEKLPEQTYNHSLRVYYFGIIMAKQQFPNYAASLSPVTWALSCLLHDLGTADANMAATRLSFEFDGAIQALHLLRDELGAPKDQAEAVCEAIIRHQDLGREGTITFLGQLIQLATVYDNVGAHPHVENFGDVIHAKTRDDVNRAFPRKGWLGCFARTIRKEVAAKPWCHTTHIPDFDRQVEGNELMKPYEEDDE